MSVLNDRLALQIPQRVVVLLPSLSRDNDYEVIVAVRAIGEALKSARLDWHDIAQVLADACSDPSGANETGPPSAWRPSSNRSHAFGDLARGCRDLDRGRLMPRERAFVADMVRRGFSFRPSPRQELWLADILDRLQSGRAAA